MPSTFLFIHGASGLFSIFYIVKFLRIYKLKEQFTVGKDNNGKFK
jgi:hypothetical protein